MKIKSIILFACFLVALTTYVVWNKLNHKIEIQRGFYFWEADRSSLYSLEKETIDSLKIKKLYVKLFEIERNETFGDIPVEKSNLGFTDNYNSLKFDLIPTIYIRNEVFKNTTSKKLEELADNVNFLIDKKFNEQFKKDFPINYNEIQIDCDWTQSTQKNYFYFLKHLKKLSGKKLSATLRLYAYKFPDKMGVLPVDKAMLMCYNLLSPQDFKYKNSILDLDELKKYLVGAKDYPVSLDIALPIYSAVQIYHNNQFKGRFYNEDSTFINALKPEKKFWYSVQRDTVFNELFLRKGDLVKYEKCAYKDVLKALDIIFKNVHLDLNTTLTLYHLQQSELELYTNEELDSIYNGITR
jgi:hypothetical protein